MILGIDPGLKGNGLGLILTHGQRVGKLVAVTFVKGHAGRDASVWAGLALRTVEEIQKLCEPSMVVIEQPQIYTRSNVKRKARHEDILQVAGVVGALAGAIRLRWEGVEILSPLPREWKGQVPKTVHHHRLLNDDLDEQELALLEPILSKHLPDALDGVGLARWGWKQRLKLSAS